MVKPHQEKSSSPRWAWITVIIILAVLGLLSMLIAGVIGIFVGAGSSSSSIEKVNGVGNVAVIKVEGPIVSTSVPSFGGARAAVSEDIVKLIEKASKDNGIKAIVLAINTPGGSAVASDEISSALNEVKKPTVAWIKDIGTSGGYWVASSTDYIVAHPASITASIGVIGSYLEFAGFLEDYNVTYRRLVSGKYKDMGHPFKQMTEEEEMIFQQTLDDLHELFIEHVAEGRSMPAESVRTLATGAFMSGKKAYELGLVDQLGGQKEVKAYLQQKLNSTVDFVQYRQPKTFFQTLVEGFSESGFQVGRGIGSSLVEQERQPSVMLS